MYVYRKFIVCMVHTHTQLCKIALYKAQTFHIIHSMHGMECSNRYVCEGMREGGREGEREGQHSTNFPYNTQHGMDCSNRYVCMYIGNLLFAQRN